VWMVGEVASAWWFGQDGFPATRVAISIQPLVRTTSDTCKGHLNNLTMPRNSLAEGFGPDQVRATKWMTKRGARGQASTTEEFKEVYDTRTVFRAKPLMTRLTVDQIKEHDIVLVEARICRYAVKLEGAVDVKGKKRAMDRWQAFYDLSAVSVLKDASGT
ncbi:hypothetical protein C8J57DRAFT_1068868, partial [Mycena rebaudengoi]